jgi:LemA protein
MGILIVVVALALVLSIALYNTLIARKNEVKNSFATIDAMLKQRFDLIPNIVATVKESAKFESSTLEKVIAMRGQMTSGMSTQQLQKIDQESSNALRGFMIQVEAYPDLKSSQNFAQLQNALHEVEEQLAAARRTYNAAVTNYNNALEMFPTSMLASMMALKPEGLLSIPETERKNVNVGELFKA